MTIKGNDLIVSDESGALAASKSCTLSVNASTLEYSHPDIGDWKHVLARGKSWKLSTTHLVKASDGNATPLKDALGRVGKTYTLSLSNRQLSGDTLSGQAVCTIFKVTATRGSLLQGSFEWEGSGPLE